MSNPVAPQRPDLIGIAPPWSVALIASRETPETLALALAGAVRAAASHGAVIDVLVNGERALAEAMVGVVDAVDCPASVQLRLWFIALGDKAHAWNVFVHELYIPGSVAFFLDGYVIANIDAFVRINALIDGDEDLAAVSGIPTAGRTAPALAAHLVATQGLHGNLHGIAPASMLSLREHCFKLPLGLYRVDGMVGAVLRYRCQPALYGWQSGKIIVDAGVSWSLAGNSGWPWARLRGALKRKLRQAQGELENLAMRNHLTIRKRPANEMDGQASQFIDGWRNENPIEAGILLNKSPLVRHAARRLAAPRDWSAAGKAKELLATRGAPR